jgi:hypothetical protein
MACLDCEGARYFTSSGERPLVQVKVATYSSSLAVESSPPVRLQQYKCGGSFPERRRISARRVLIKSPAVIFTGLVRSKVPRYRTSSAY